MSTISQRYRALFDSPNGEAVLSDLKAQFYDLPSLAAPDPHMTTVRAAQRDVVQYIIDFVEGRDE